METEVVLRRGVFGRYTIQGIKSHDGNGNPGWEITAYIQSVSASDSYWVSGEDFHSMSVHIPLDGSPQQVHIHGVITGINPEEKKAVLDAIALWETPAPQNPVSVTGDGENK